MNHDRLPFMYFTLPGGKMQTTPLNGGASRNVEAFMLKHAKTILIPAIPIFIFLFLPCANLARAMDKNEIIHLQTRLKEKGHDPGPIDGAWGDKTEAALREFQKKHDLETSGRLNPRTRLALGLDESTGGPGGGGVEETWTRFSEGEVSMMVPDDWVHARNPAKGVLFQFDANPSDGRAFFSHMLKSDAQHGFELSEKDKHAWRLVAESIHGRLERSGVAASIKSEKLIRLNGRNALDVRLDIGNPLSVKGFCRFVFIKAKNIGYGFMAFSLGGDSAARGETFDAILSSIEIDESKIPEHVGPGSYAELAHMIKGALVHGLKGIPPLDWKYALKDVRTRKVNETTDLIIEASLDRDDAALLADGFVKIIDSLRKGIETPPDRLGCDPDSLMMFSNHVSMMLGLALGFSNNPALPLENIHIVLSDGGGAPAAHYTANIAKMMKAFQSEDNMQFILAIEPGRN